MLSRSSSSVLFVLAALLMASSCVHAFTTTSSSSSPIRTIAPGRSIQGARYQPKASSDLVLASILRKMSSSDDEEAAKSKISADGTFYDDEVSYISIIFTKFYVMIARLH
jgi:hypothetical protein